MTDEVVAPKTEDEIQAEAAAAGQAYRDKFAAGTDDATPPTETPDETPADDAPVKPEHVPEKFWDAETGAVNYEAWNTAHSALETKFHSKDETPDGSENKDDASADDATDGDSTEEKNALATPAATKAAESYAENGSLTDADYTALEADGISRDMADAYIAGKESKAAEINNAAYEPAGGQEQYEAMIAWSAKNLDEPSKLAFNSQLATGNPDVIRAAVTALAAEYSKEATVEGDRVGGGATSNNSSTFASRAEMTQAINKLDDNGRRMYDVDPAYRTEVATKIGNSRRAKTFRF